MFKNLKNILYNYVYKNKLDNLGVKFQALSPTERSILGSILLSAGQIDAFKQCIGSERKMFEYSRNSIEHCEIPFSSRELYSPQFFTEAINHHRENLIAYLEMGGRLISKVFFKNLYKSKEQWEHHIPLQTLIETKYGSGKIKLPTELLLLVFEAECFHGTQKTPVLKKIKLFHEKLLHNFLDITAESTHLRQLANLYPLPLRSAQLLIKNMTSSSMEEPSIKDVLPKFKKLLEVILDDHARYLQNKEKQPQKTIFNFSDHAVSIKNRTLPTAVELKYEQYFLSIFEYTVCHENRGHPTIPRPSGIKNKPMNEAEYNGLQIRGNVFLRTCQFNFYFENPHLLSHGLSGEESQKHIDASLSKLVEKSIPKHMMAFEFLLPWMKDEQKFKAILTNPMDLPKVYSALTSWASSRLEQDKHYQLESGGIFSEPFDVFFKHFYQESNAFLQLNAEKRKRWLYLGTPCFNHLLYFSQRKMFLLNAILEMPSEKLNALIQSENQNKSFFFLQVKKQYMDQNIKPLPPVNRPRLNMNPRF